MVDSFKLEKIYTDEMVSHAKEEAPNECCGLLAGSDGRVTRLYRCTNAAHSPYRYMVDPHDLIAVYEELHKNGWELLGIYHSHTHTESYPSPTDIKSAVLTQALYFIVSLSSPDKPIIKAFYISEGSVKEVELAIVEC
jgi:proteasome lid subunit RPN8/RPN11